MRVLPLCSVPVRAQASRKPDPATYASAGTRRRRRMTASQTERANAFRALHERAGRLRHPQPVRRRHGAHPGRARLRGARDHQRRLRLRPRPARRDGAITRDEALAHARTIVEATPLAGLGRSRERLRRCARGRRRRPSGSPPRPGSSAARSRTRAAIPQRPIYDLAHAVERIAAAVEAARALACRSCSPRAPRTSCTAGPISTTRSGACRRSRRRAPTCSTRRACVRSSRSARSARR